jgi:hypothetical protein
MPLGAAHTNKRFEAKPFRVCCFTNAEVQTLKKCAVNADQEVIM